MFFETRKGGIVYTHSGRFLFPPTLFECVCVCMCVCGERERERERDRGKTDKSTRDQENGHPETKGPSESFFDTFSRFFKTVLTI